MFACPAKWAFTYYKVKNKDGKFVNSVSNQEEYELKEGETFEKVTYGGCPAFQSKLL